MPKSLTNKLLLKKKLYGLKMAEGSALDQHINVFKQIISDLNRVDVKFEEEDMTLILVNSLLESYDNLVSTTLMWGKETLELEEIIGALLAFNQMKKDSDGSRMKGLWPRVIRSVGETILGVSQVETNLDQNQGEGRIFSVTSAEKRGT